MTRRALATALLSSLVVLPATAVASERIDPDRACYIAGKHDTITLTGTNFPPNEPFVAYTGETPGPDPKDEWNLNVTGTIGPDGSLNVSFPRFNVEHGGRYEPDITVQSTVYEGNENAFLSATHVRIISSHAGLFTFHALRRGAERFGVYNRPENATQQILGLPFDQTLLTTKPKRLRHRDIVQFIGIGFGDGTQPKRKSLYIHYVDPRGKHMGDFLLGRVGACGIASSKTGRYLFHNLSTYEKPAPGTWKLQFDWNKRYSKNANDAKWIYAKVDRKGWVTFPGNVVYDYPR